MYSDKGVTVPSYMLKAIDEEKSTDSVKALLLKHLAISQYCEYEWLALYKGNIVRASIKNIMNFGSITTSRAEGYHAKIKRYLQTSRNDFVLFLLSYTDSL